ncbi:hypothetical protein [Nitrosomonas mobilis]|uniref:hypothetical protein n=1 Tax=Nitrosomonas mobilis TaxID=51642 RepID=UPI000B8013A6|nr:hypothetical protein [Nitrosomonas mobilis]HNO75665.1 hypothetical protein [Nitrosomonas mobilis]
MRLSLGLGTNAANRRLQWRQRCIRSHLGQAGHPLPLYKRGVAGQCFHDALDDPAEQALLLLSRR